MPHTTPVAPAKKRDRVVGKRRTGNPNWGKPTASLGPVSVTPTLFEQKVAALGLKQPDRYPQSKELRLWIMQHYKSCYVPEHLLDLWGLTLDGD